MDNHITFNEHGEWIGRFANPELGPLRPSSLTDEQKAALLPPWAYLDHEPLIYVTTADHRSTEGRIVRQGTPCSASRQNGLVMLVPHEHPYGTVVLDGKRWVLDIDSAPKIRSEDYPELFLPA